MEDIRTIIRALRCTSTPGHKACAGCPYDLADPLPEPLKSLAEEDGLAHSCDSDRICQDAAEMLVQVSCIAVDSIVLAARLVTDQHQTDDEVVAQRG